MMNNIYKVLVLIIFLSGCGVNDSNKGQSLSAVREPQEMPIHAQIIVDEFVLGPGESVLYAGDPIRHVSLLATERITLKVIRLNNSDFLFELFEGSLYGLEWSEVELKNNTQQSATVAITIRNY